MRGSCRSSDALAPRRRRANHSGSLLEDEKEEKKRAEESECGEIQKQTGRRRKPCCLVWKSNSFCFLFVDESERNVCRRRRFFFFSLLFSFAEKSSSRFFFFFLLLSPRTHQNFLPKMFQQQQYQRPLTEQERIDQATMRIDNPNVHVVGSGALPRRRKRRIDCFDGARGRRRRRRRRRRRQRRFVCCAIGPLEAFLALHSVSQARVHVI